MKANQHSTIVLDEIVLVPYRYVHAIALFRINISSFYAFVSREEHVAVRHNVSRHTVLHFRDRSVSQVEIS